MIKKFISLKKLKKNRNVFVEQCKVSNVDNWAQNYFLKKKNIFLRISIRQNYLKYYEKRGFTIEFLWAYLVLLAGKSVL